MKQKLVLGLAIAGLAFSGYLGGVKLFGGTCAFNETCATFLGYPTCYYGFLMFLAITLFAVMLMLGKMSKRGAKKAILLIAGVGICFAGYFTFREFAKIFDEGLGAYMLGLPTCAYGFVVYTILFGVAWTLPTDES